MSEPASLLLTTLPATLLVILILPTGGPTGLIATLATGLIAAALATLTALTTLLLAVTLSGIARIRASHKASI